MTHRIDKAGVLPRGQALGLGRRVAHHVEQLLVAPHVMLERRVLEKRVKKTLERGAETPIPGEGINPPLSR